MTDKARQTRITHALEFFVAQKWTRAQACGIVANLLAESGLQSIQQNGGGPGYGIGQWEGLRQAAFKRWAGHDIRQSTVDEQLAFVQHELETSEQGAGNALRATTTAREAGEVICRRYERPKALDAQADYRGGLADSICKSADFSNVTSGSASTAPPPTE